MIDFSAPSLFMSIVSPSIYVCICVCVCVCVCVYTHTNTHMHTVNLYTHTHTTEALGNAGRRRAATVGAHYALDPGSQDGCLTQEMFLDGLSSHASHT
jgi:hypothetical protein